MTPRGHALVATALAATVMTAVNVTRVYAWGAVVVTLLAFVVLVVGTMPGEFDGWAVFVCAVFGVLWPGLAVAALLLFVEMSIDRRKGAR